MNARLVIANPDKAPQAPAAPTLVIEEDGWIVVHSAGWYTRVWEASPGGRAPLTCHGHGHLTARLQGDTIGQALDNGRKTETWLSRWNWSCQMT